MACVYVLMGVSGSGKSTVGRALAQELDCPFYDGDDFHAPENVAKMARGIPLDDTDRYPWLARLNDLISDHLTRGETAVVTCSALKKQYRDRLRAGNQSTVFVYLEGDFDLIWRRMKRRHGHFMKSEMLKSQFEALQAPERIRGSVQHQRRSGREHDSQGHFVIL
jgi:gluconokinase